MVVKRACGKIALLASWRGLWTAPTSQSTCLGMKKGLSSSQVATNKYNIIGSRQNMNCSATVLGISTTYNWWETKQQKMWWVEPPAHSQETICCVLLKFNSDFGYCFFPTSVLFSEWHRTIIVCPYCVHSVGMIFAWNGYRKRNFFVSATWGDETNGPRDGNHLIGIFKAINGIPTWIDPIHFTRLLVWSGDMLILVWSEPCHENDQESKNQQWKGKKSANISNKMSSKFADPLACHLLGIAGEIGLFHIESLHFDVQKKNGENEQTAHKCHNIYWHCLMYPQSFVQNHVCRSPGSAEAQLLPLTPVSAGKMGTV